jgi:hypothetical protein
MIIQDKILLETQFFPTINYVAALLNTPSVFLETKEHFQKGTYRNRCQIATAQGSQTLSVPLKKGKNTQQIITDVQISYDIDWQRPMWRTLQTAYGNAPYWEHYAPIFEPFFTKQYEFLFEYNLEIIKAILKVFKRDKSISISFTNNYEAIFTDDTSQDSREGSDLRNHFSPKSNNLNTQRYAQVFEDRNGFIPHLSILDLIFCCGKNGNTSFRS